jgi:hypothetical protein
VAEKQTGSLKEALVDVRRAYALLDAYQKRVLNMCKYVGDKFDMQFYQTDFSTGLCPKRADNPFSRDPKVFLPLFNIAFLFLSTKRVEQTDLTKANEWMLAVRVLADTDEAKKKNDDLKEWTGTISAIGFYAFKSTEDKKRNWFWDLFCNVDWPTSGNVLPYPAMAAEGYGRLFPMDDLFDKNAINDAVSVFAEEIKKKLKVNATIRDLNNA